MKIVIDIDEEMYEDANILIVKDLPILKKIIADGTPLPESYGDLIDRDKLLEELVESDKSHAENSREETLLYRNRTIIREQPAVIAGYLTT